MDALIFLMKLAWNCRLRLPLLITIGFMIFDIRMQLDINVESRRIPRPPEDDDNDDDRDASGYNTPNSGSMASSNDFVIPT